MTKSLAPQQHTGSRCHRPRQRDHLAGGGDETPFTPARSVGPTPSAVPHGHLRDPDTKGGTLMSDTDRPRSHARTSSPTRPAPARTAPAGAARRSWHGDGFRVELFRAPATGNGSAFLLSYRVFDTMWASLSGQDPLIFAGDDLGVATPADTGDVAVAALSAIFGTESGDVAETYFATYSPAQRTWRDARAGDLARWGSTLTEAHERCPAPGPLP